MFPSSAISPEAATAFLLEWGEIVKEVGQEKFDIALTNAIRDTHFFPSIAAIRRQVGFTAEAIKQVEAEAAWQAVQKHLHTHWGRPEGVPRYTDSRIEYAVRACGGNRVLADMDLKAMPFIKKDFCEAYGNAPLAAALNLLRAVPRKELTAISSPPEPPEPTPPKPTQKQLPAEDVETRREVLKKQASELLERIGKGAKIESLSEDRRELLKRQAAEKQGQ